MLFSVMEKFTAFMFAGLKSQTHGWNFKMYLEKELIEKLNDVIKHQQEELAIQDRIIFLLKKKFGESEVEEIIKFVQTSTEDRID